MLGIVLGASKEKRHRLTLRWQCTCGTGREGQGQWVCCMRPGKALLFTGHFAEYFCVKSLNSGNISCEIDCF